MPQALQVVTFYKQNLAGTVFEALTLGSGDPVAFSVVPVGSLAYLAEVMGVDDASPAEISIIASNFHDQIEGLAGWVPDGSTLAPVNRSSYISPPGIDQPIESGDIPTVRAKGAAADNVNVTFVVYHADLPGVAAKLRGYDQVRAATVNLLGVDATVDCSSVTQGDWSSPVSLTAAARRLNASKWYALLGFTTDVPAAAIAVSGFETGNLKIGGPALADGAHDANLIADLAERYNAPLIPVFNGANQDNIFVYGADPDATNVKVAVQLAELSSAL